MTILVNQPDVKAPIRGRGRRLPQDFVNLIDPEEDEVFSFTVSVGSFFVPVRFHQLKRALFVPVLCLYMNLYLSIRTLLINYSNLLKLS